MMSRVRNAAVAVAVLTMACSDSTGLAPADLAGTWTAQSMVFTAVANTATTFDVIANGGSFAITMNADLTYSSSMTFMALTDAATGTYAVSGSTITVADTGEGSATPFTAVRDGNNMTITAANETWDFDGDGAEDDATLVINLTR